MLHRSLGGMELLLLVPSGTKADIHSVACKMSVIFSWCWKEWGKKFALPSPIVRLIFKSCFALALKAWKESSASYRNKDSFITSLFVNTLTGTKGWEEKQRGSGEGMGGEWKREEERKREEKRREEKTASVHENCTEWKVWRIGYVMMLAPCALLLI